MWLLTPQVDGAEPERIITFPNHHVAYLRFHKTGNRVTAFAVNLVRIVDSRAFEVYRADTTYGYLHEHTWAKGRQRIRDLEDPTRPNADYTQALNEAWQKAKEIAHADDPTRRARRPGIAPEGD